MKRTHLAVNRKRARAIAVPAGGLSFRDAVMAVLATLAFLAAALAAAPRADAQVFNSTPYTAAPDPAVEQLRARIEQLENDLKKAVDKAEVLGAQLSDAKRTADDANAGRKRAEADLAALATRVQALEDMVTDARNASAPAAGLQPAEATVSLAAPGRSGPAVDVAALPQDEEGFFNEAHNILMGGDFASAQSAFTAFLAKYPKGSKAGDAQFFLGESMLYQDNYSGAAAAYGKVVKEYPNGAKGPDALVKLARALRLMDKPGDACKTLDLMAKQFPKASAGAKQLAATERQRANCKA